MFTIYVERNIKRSGYLDRVAAKLNLVDLAGCERMKCADTITPCGKEICSVNKALTFLEQVIQLWSVFFLKMYGLHLNLKFILLLMVRIIY